MKWETSLRAWADMQGRLREAQLQVFGIVCEYTPYPKWEGICDNEMHHRACEKYGVRAYSTYRSRRCELVHLGLVVPSGVTREPYTGPAGTRPQTVWRAISNEEYTQALAEAGGLENLLRKGLARIAATKSGDSWQPSLTEVELAIRAGFMRGTFEEGITRAAGAVHDLYRLKYEGGKA